MSDDRDPIAEAAESEVDLYDVATWEERTSLDGLSVAVYRLLAAGSRVGVVAFASLLLLVVVGWGTLTDPRIGLLTVLSAVPALGLAGYVWYVDDTESEPLSLLVGTFLLGVLTANFAAVLNGVAAPPLQALGAVGVVASYVVVVGPVEESVKLLAVRLWAYEKPSFGTVVDGAVYGAMAGLGFAVIENALYISRGVPPTGSVNFIELVGVGGEITAVRALAGPGHVIYSAFAGYYLGLAKFNPEHRGPIVVKGLVIAALVHALYNTLAGVGAGLIAEVLGVGSFVGLLLFVLVYDGVFGLLLLRKLGRYHGVYRDVIERDGEPTGEAGDGASTEVVADSAAGQGADGSMRGPREATDEADTREGGTGTTDGMGRATEGGDGVTKGSGGRTDSSGRTDSGGRTDSSGRPERSGDGR